jgi:hypothetical protein
MPLVSSTEACDCRLLVLTAVMKYRENGFRSVTARHLVIEEMGGSGGSIPLYIHDIEGDFKTTREYSLALVQAA